MNKRLILFLFLIVSVRLSGQKVLKDINTKPASIISVRNQSGDRCFTCSNYVYFTAKDSLGQEIWRTDGTPVGTVRVKDLNPGSGDGVFEHDPVWCINGTAYFRSISGLLWKTNGTEAGTSQVTQSFIAQGGLWPLKDKMYFVTTNQTLFVTSGAVNAESQLYLTTIESGLFYRVLAVEAGLDYIYTIINIYNNAGVNRIELWRIDGTANGLQKVRELPANPGYPFYKFFKIIQNKVYFYGWDPTHGYELWSSDGTEAGTSMVADLTPGTNSSQIYYSSVYNNKLIFDFNNSDTYVSDGTTSGTVKLLGNIFHFVGREYQNSFYYLGSQNSGQVSLVKTDGTVAGTQVIDNLGQSRFSDEFLVINNKLLFRYEDSVTGVELGITNGTSGDAHIIKNINPGAPGSDLRSFTEFNGKMVFIANDGSHGYELWITDGTEAGTSLVKDVVTGTESANISSIHTLESGLFFLAGENQNERDLWSSDGTSAGTKLKRDFLAPVIFGNTNSDLIILDQGKILKANGSAGDADLWDFPYNGWGYGTDRGITAGANVYLRVKFDTNNEDVWKADTNAKSVTSVVTAEGNTVPTSLKFTGAALGNEIVFTAQEATHGEELWVTTGSGQKKALLKDIHPGTQTSSPCCFVSTGDKVFFAARDGVNGRELWVTDGTTAGTKMVKDIGPGASEGFNQNTIAKLGNSVVFSGFDGIDSEPWISDGTAAGTVKLKNINTGSSNPSNFTLIDNKVYFSATDNTYGTELFVTDGTEGNTRLIDIFPGSQGSKPSNIVKAGKAIYFYSEKKIWRTMGTTETSELAGEIEVLSGLYSFGNTVCFVAQDKLVGRELFGMEITKFRQQIDLTAIGSHVVNSAPFQIEVKATSGLPVVISTTSDKIFINSGVITFNKPGKATINFSQAGDANFSAAPPLSETICINPPKPTITTVLNENSISLLTSSSEKNNYWYRDDTPLGETSSQLSISEPGVYKLKVSVDGCDSEFDTVEIIITAIGDKTGVISLYPNPTSETVNVRVPFVTPTSYQIHDANGRLIDARSSSNRDEQFDVSLYPKGTYILTIRNGSVSKSHLVVKK